MSEPSSVTGSSRADQLQDLTKPLAAARTQEAVLAAALGSARALGARSVAVLLLNASGQTLNVAAH